jgi:hypothetical protein
MPAIPALTAGLTKGLYVVTGAGAVAASGATVSNTVVTVSNAWTGAHLNETGLDAKLHESVKTS